MKFLRTIAALTIAASTAVCSIAPAAHARGYEVGMPHSHLIQAIKATGIQFRLNPASCDQDTSFGWYWAAKNELVVCQTLRNRGGNYGQETVWTNEDLDTLRHEAHHLVQDCMKGGYRDGLLGSVYVKPIRFGLDVLGQDFVQTIVKEYSEAGVDKHSQIMEVEAFAVAYTNDPAEQVRDVYKFCS